MLHSKMVDFSKYKAVVFDFDGTLYAPAKLGLKIVFSDLRNHLKAKRERNARKVLAGQDFGSSSSFYKQFFAIVGEKNRDWYFNQYLPLMVHILQSKFVARIGAQHLIDGLIYKGMQVGVLSDYPMVAERTEAIGLNISKQNMWSTENMGALKPSPRPFIEVAHKLNVEPCEMLVIGDRPETDGVGAQSAGADCVIVKTKKNSSCTTFNVLDWDEIVSGIN